MGTEVTKAETRKRLKEGAADALADVNKADADASVQEKKEAMKTALANALGKAKTEIQNEDVEFFKVQGARAAVGKNIKACVEAARANNEGDAKKTQRKDAVKACKSKAKEALKEVLGDAEVSDEKVEVFKLKNAKKEIADLRSACMDTATVEEDKKKCVDEGRDLLKKTLASVLGKDDED